MNGQRPPGVDDRTRTVDQLRAHARELSDSYWTQTPAYTKTRGGRTKLVGVHRVEQDGLLAQLAEVAALGLATSDDVHGARPVAQSRPPGQWEALARLTAITLWACRWVWDLDLPQRDSVQGNVRQLAAAAGEPRILGDDQVVALARDMRSWHVQAQAAVGWVTAPYEPRATCPVLTCGRHGTLRVNLARRAAYCVGCESVWDEGDGSIGVLAEHIARQSESRVVLGERVRSSRSGHGAWLADHPIG